MIEIGRLGGGTAMAFLDRGLNGAGGISKTIDT